MSSFPRSAIVSLTFALACTSVPAADDEAGVTTSPGTDEGESSASTTSTSTTDTTSTSTTDPASTSTTDTASDDTSGFVPFTDIQNDSCMCDPFAQDCTEGEKCVAYSAEGEVWDCVKCVPVLGDQAVGESCFYDGIVAGTDDCDASSWCFTLEGEGTCHAFCTGTADAPECPPGSQCLLTNEGNVSVCVPD